MKIAINNEGYITRRLTDDFLKLNPHLDTDSLIVVSQEELEIINSFQLPKQVNEVWTEGFINMEEIIIPETISVIPFLVQVELMGITESDIIDKINQLHQAEVLNAQEKIEALISIKRATRFERNHPFVNLIAGAFQKSKEEIDQIFINGNK